MTATDDDEWEYEYDDTETEDFYLQLDLSNIPSEQVSMASMGRPGHPTLLKSRLRALNAQVGQPAGITVDPSTEQETASMGELQIIGLDTPNPLVMYNGQLLSCHWTSTIGTDMFFVKPDASANTRLPPPLRSLPSVDLLALGSAKLIAKTGRLRPRDDLFDDSSNTNTQMEPTELASTSATSQATSGQLDAVSEETRSVPTGFLAKLNEAKAKRGETSRLVLSKNSNGSRVVSEELGEGSDPLNGISSAPPDEIVMGGT